MAEPAPQLEGTFTEAEQRFDRIRRDLGRPLGPALFLLLLLVPPGGLGPEAARLAAVLSWVLVWWLTEAVPIAVTALLGPALAASCGVGSAKELLAPFGDPVIFLFLGSFVLAEAMALHGLDRRLAEKLLRQPFVAASPVRMMLAFVALSAALSMWLSNTATTAMLYPIALGALASLDLPAKHAARLAPALLLACAYGASIGGIGTPVGTPPNLIALGQLVTLAGVRISFFEWMLVAALPMLAMLAAVLVLVGLRSSRIESRARLAEATAAKPLSRGERNVIVAFSAAVVLWVAPGAVALVAGSGSPVSTRLSALLPESVVALLAAAALFVLPVDWRARRFTIAWQDAARIDWGTLLLFGGGLSLGSAMFTTGLAKHIGDAIVRLTGASTEVSLTFAFSILAIYLTEVTSNTATSTMLLPLVIAAAQSAGASPVAPAIATAIGASMAFMLPVATPPNAIVYGSGRVPITVMVRSGFWLNASAALLVPALVLLACRLLKIGG